MRAAVLLLAGPALNFNIDRMAGRTGMPRAFVAACTRRLFDNGIWEHAGPVYTWKTPADEDFWRDVAVGEGNMHRRRGQNGQIEWAEPGVWKKEYVLARDVIAPLAISYACDTDHPHVKPPAQENIERLPTKPKSIFNTATPRPLGRARKNIAPLAAIEGSDELVMTDATVERKNKMDLFPEANWL